MRITSPTRVDPRVCGGGPLGLIDERTKTGRSPRMRGRPCRNELERAHTGSIPAYAGEAMLICDIGGATRVDPRVCGGGMNVICMKCEKTGRSPRMRGRPLDGTTAISRRGSIPAYAGEAVAGWDG